MSQSRKRVRGGAARKSSPSRRGRKLKVGDRVRIVEIPRQMKEPNYDLRWDTAEPKLRTGELFRFCLGREFTVRGFGRYAHVEAEASDDPSVRRKFGKFNTIWIEPEFLERMTVRNQGPQRSKTGKGTTFSRAGKVSARVERHA